MKIHKRIFCFCIAGVFLLNSCAGTKPEGAGFGKAPEWMRSLEAVYPDATYLAALGYGDTRRNAEASALAALASRFKLTIEADVQAQERYLEIVKESASYSQKETSLLQSVHTNTGVQTFNNVQFSDPWTDSRGIVNIVAYLQRAESGKIYLDLIRKDASLIDSLESRSAAAPSGLIRFALLDTASQVSKNSDVLYEQLKMIHTPSAGMAKSLIHTQDLLTKRAQAAEKLGFYLQIKGESSDIISSIVRKTMSDFGIPERSSGPMVVSGEIRMTEGASGDKYQSVTWSLNLSLTDETGASVVNMFKEAKENAVSVQAAQGFAVQEIEKAIKAEFIKKITQYLDSVSLAK